MLSKLRSDSTTRSGSNQTKNLKGWFSKLQENLTLMPQQQRGSHAETDHDHRPPHKASPESSSDSRTTISARNRSHYHDQREWPFDFAGDNEVGGRHHINAHREKIFEPVHLMQIGQAHQPQRCQHQNTHSRSEISAIDRNKKLKSNCAAPPRARRRTLRCMLRVHF